VLNPLPFLKRVSAVALFLWEYLKYKFAKNR